MENLEVVKGIPVERMMIETDSPYCEIKNTHAGINFVKSVWPSKKKEKYDEECTVKGRNEPCFVRCEHYLLVYVFVAQLVWTPNGVVIMASC